MPTWPTAGRSSVASASRRTSTEPRMVPRRGSSAIAAAAASMAASTPARVIISEPEEELPGGDVRRALEAAVTAVVLVHRLGDQVPPDVIPAAGLEPRDVRVPGDGHPRRAVEAEVVHPRGGVQPGPHLVAALDEERARAEGPRHPRLADGGNVPSAPDAFRAD